MHTHKRVYVASIHNIYIYIYIYIYVYIYIFVFCSYTVVSYIGYVCIYLDETKHKW